MRFKENLLKSVSQCKTLLYDQLVSIYLWLYSSLLDLGRFFSFLNLHTVGRTHLTRDQPVARSLHTHRTTQTQNKRTYLSMPRVGFESTIPAFERAKTVHALDRAATLIGINYGSPSRLTRVNA
jgi:hypothetical protein